MTEPARRKALATQARRVFLEALLKGVAPIAAALGEAGHQLLQMAAEYPIQLARRDGVAAWTKHGEAWQSALIHDLRHSAAGQGIAVAAPPSLDTPPGRLSLVDDRTIEREITTSRLALAIMDRATWEFTDLRTRMQFLEQQDDLPAQDLLRAPVIAGLIIEAWQRSELGASEWRLFQGVLHEEFAHLLSEAYHEINHWLVEHEVLPEVDLRPFIRRSPQARQGALLAALTSVASATSTSGGLSINSSPVPVSGHGPMSGGSLDETRYSPRLDANAVSPSHAQAAEVLRHLQRIVGSQVPAMAKLGTGAPAMPDGPSVPASARLSAAINRAQEALVRRHESQHPAQGVQGADGDKTIFEPYEAPSPQALEELRVRNQAFKQVLKQAADTPAERATIELVAMMFQSILTEERIPAAVRVWFARLQMPVLRVAVSEPDFFAETEHPARRLIDRMGACVMGFSSSSSAGGDAVEREIKRVVQVVEAYPDTGRRVFQTVLTEFEKFLDNYFEKENQASAKGVSLAQQVEQRETLAIQYTIELRKMLNEVPVQDGVREFLFQVWADVLAVTAVRAGASADVTRQMKRAAADLIWSASAKVSREERADVIRRLPPLLKTLRDGMGHAGLAVERQDEHIRLLNNSLAAAFTAKTAAIPRERLDELMDQLETLEAMLPDSTDGTEIDDTLMRDLSGHETEGLEVVAEGGSAPTPAMMAWAKELPVGGWFMLDYRARNEAVQLAWRGQRRDMVLFVSPKGRGVLFQLTRLAAFLQAGLLLPAQEESLTVKATRTALAKLDVDPSRLLN